MYINIKVIRPRHVFIHERIVGNVSVNACVRCKYIHDAVTIETNMVYVVTSYMYIYIHEQIDVHVCRHA